MRPSVCILVFVLGGGCDRAPSPGEVAEAGWEAHARLIAAGERAATCAEAGAAMQRAFDRDRAAFVAAFALERDQARMSAATRYMETHADRYRDLETRTDALAERCAADPTVDAVFARLELPE